MYVCTVHVCVCVFMYMYVCMYVSYVHVHVCVYMSWLICANGHHGDEVIMNTLMELLIKPHQDGRRCTSMVAVQSSLAGHRFPWRLLITHGATP